MKSFLRDPRGSACGFLFWLPGRCRSGCIRRERRGVFVSRGNAENAAVLRKFFLRDSAWDGLHMFWYLPIKIEPSPYRGLDFTHNIV